MGSDLIDDRSPELSETHPAKPPVMDYSLGYWGFATTAPFSATPTSQAPDARVSSSVLPGPPEEAPPPERGTRDRRRLWRYLLVPLVLLLALAGGIGGGFIGASLAPAPATPTPTINVSPSVSPNVTGVQQAVEDVSQSAQPSVVELSSRGASGAATGSGVILTKDGYIATNDHMVQGFTTYTVTLSNGTSLPARLIGEATQDDLAVLKVTASDLKPITFADSNAVKVGQFVVALGSPVGFENSATFGIVSALNRSVSEAPDGPATELTGLIQTNVTLNPGNSGGALLDLEGRMIGMPTLGVNSTPNGQDVDGIGFAIPSNQVKSITAQLIQEADN